MTYLIIRECDEKDSEPLRTFKERMIAARPEFAKEIHDDFERAAQRRVRRPDGRKATRWTPFSEWTTTA